MITALYRHRGFRDASNGVPIERTPPVRAPLRRAWREGWAWFHTGARK